MSEPRPTSAEIEAAAARLNGLIWRTPLVHSGWLSDAIRADVWLKLEIVQTTGSFKLRGALNALAGLRERAPGATTVVAASAGNHGLALAWAARHFSMRARVYVPSSAPAAKREALGRMGAEVVEAASYEAAEVRAHEDAQANECPYVSPYDDPDVIAGAGTITLEMLSDRPDLDAIVVPLGGGGLLAGTAIVARAARRESNRDTAVQAIGAEAAASPVFSTALAAGRVVPVTVQPTIADGLAGNMDPASRTLALVRDFADRITMVSEESIGVAMRGLFEHERLIVEGAGATGVGALLDGGLGLAGRRVGVVLTGRNVDPDTLRGVL